MPTKSRKERERKGLDGSNPARSSKQFSGKLRSARMQLEPHELKLRLAVRDAIEPRRHRPAPKQQSALHLAPVCTVYRLR